MHQNKLVINSDKTHLLVMTTDKKHKKYENFNITLDTGREIIEPQDVEILLGGQKDTLKHILGPNPKGM